MNGKYASTFISLLHIVSVSSFYHTFIIFTTAHSPLHAYVSLEAVTRKCYEA